RQGKGRIKRGCINFDTPSLLLVGRKVLIKLYGGNKLLIVAFGHELKAGLVLYQRYFVFVKKTV
ncbi:hypothetical protein, partial [Prevotella aurantiaca]